MILLERTGWGPKTMASLIAARQHHIEPPDFTGWLFSFQLLRINNA